MRSYRMGTTLCCTPTSLTASRAGLGPLSLLFPPLCHAVPCVPDHHHHHHLIKPPLSLQRRSGAQLPMWQAGCGLRLPRSHRWRLTRTHSAQRCVCRWRVVRMCEALDKCGPTRSPVCLLSCRLHHSHWWPGQVQQKQAPLCTQVG